MFKRKASSSRLSDLETENRQLKLKIETLERENAELREVGLNKLKQSFDEAAITATSQGLEPSNHQSRAASATADSRLGTDSEQQKTLNEEQSNRTMTLELRKQLLDVQMRLTVNEQVTAATQQRELIQEGAYQHLPTDSGYEQLRFDTTQEEHVYAKLQPPGNYQQDFLPMHYC